jgi:LPXTG-motif cell wall-anchored protein
MKKSLFSLKRAFPQFTVSALVALILSLASSGALAQFGEDGEGVPDVTAAPEVGSWLIGVGVILLLGFGLLKSRRKEDSHTPSA